MRKNIEMFFASAENNRSLISSEVSSENVGMSPEYLNGLLMGTKIGAVLALSFIFLAVISGRNRS